MEWLAIAGCLLLSLSFASSFVQRLPISSSSLYLALGFVLGPQALGFLELRLDAQSAWFERLTEMAVVVALFISGLKLRLPLRHKAWASVWRLAGPVMLLCICGIALLAHYALGLSAPYALLLGAVLAPTDPVLAGAVSVSDAADKDRVKYALSGEAGLNDGTAFPFVILALEWLRQRGGGTEWVVRWVFVDVVWAVGAALAVGYLMGITLGRYAIKLRSRQRDTESPSDFVALALIALSYTTAHLLHSWSFLAVFAAGVGLRRAELGVVAETPHPELAAEHSSHPPAEHLVSARVAAQDLEAPAVAAGVLVSETISFGGTLERVLELLLVTLVGAAVGSYWDSRALLVAAVLFFALRPLGCYLLLQGTLTLPLQKLLIGWFGIRGIGSLYYLAYALSHGLDGRAGLELAGLTLSVVTLSILLHGSSATPLLDFYMRKLTAARARRKHVRSSGRTGSAIDARERPDHG
jgi:sodium/hydrogen antiporter